MITVNNNIGLYLGSLKQSFMYMGKNNVTIISNYDLTKLVQLKIIIKIFF